MESRRKYLWRLGIAVAFIVTAALLSNSIRAQEIVVKSGLQHAIDSAQSGDTLILSEKKYTGPIVIAKTLTLLGENSPHIVGNDTGNVITVTAPNTVIKGLFVTGSGLSLASQDSGIFLDKTAIGAVVEGNTVSNNLIGIYVSGAANSAIVKNRISGRKDLRMNERGNGVQVWNAPGTVVEDNTIEFGRDGIFVTTSKKNIFRRNHMQNLRFAIHYMYTDNSQIIENTSLNNDMGFALMSSTTLIVAGNLSKNDRDRGFLFNYANKIIARQNVVLGGPEKCIFIYNSNKNRFEENFLSGCEIGIHFTAGSEHNVMTGNAFVDNRAQVKYVGTRWLEWSEKGRGNYWSDHTAFDLDRNGLADSVYRPNDLTDRIIWQYPSARLLTNSPAVQVLKYAQSAFPAVHPGGVLDSAPLMQIPAGLKGARLR